MTKSYFSLDDRFLPVIGYHHPEQRWNGWACPMFPMESVELILMYLGEPDTDEDGTFWELINGELFEIYIENGKETQRRKEEPVIFEGQALYNVGAFNWVWQEDSRVLQSDMLPEVLEAYHKQTRTAQAEGRDWQNVNVCWEDYTHDNGRGNDVWHVDIDENGNSGQAAGIYATIEYYSHRSFLKDMRFLNQWEAIVREA